MAVLAEAQRQRQRQYEAQRRAAVAAQRQYEKDQREAQRAAVRGGKEALRAYQQGREADAARRTAELDGRVAELRGVLAAGLAGRPFRPADLREPVRLPAFDPGPLGVPIAMPDPARYQVPPPGGMQAFNPNARRQYDEQAAQANAHFQHDWQAAQAAEQQRLHQLAEYRAAFDAWADGQRRAAADRAALAQRLATDLRSGGADAVVELFETALRWRTDWPDGFPKDGTLGWDEARRQLVVDWQLPDAEIVPPTARIRYVKTDDRDTEVARSATDRKAVHREVLAQSALRVLAELFRTDADGLLASVVFNGYVEAVSPATGREEQRHLVSVTVGRDEFLAVDLERVEPVSCLVDGLRGRLSARPEKLEAVRTERLAAEVGGYRDAGGDEGGDEDPDLFEMDPIAFEELIAELFRRRGLRTRTTARSGDEGVDVLAEDPDPVTGGTIVIQAKRYRHTVPPTAVRDLDATMVRMGANRGILVTTSGFGPGSRRWVEGKPLTLVDGPMLLGLLKEHGLPGRLGGGPTSVPVPTSAPVPTLVSPVPTLVDVAAVAPAVPLSPGQNTVVPAAGLAEVCVRFGSAGAEADLTVLLLGADGKVRSDDDFVFYHQPSAERGAVTLHPKESGGGRTRETATLRVLGLPPAVHRITVSVNMDADSTATCGELRDAELEVRAADGSSWSFALPADPAISAMLVAELYRHHAGTPQEVWKLRAVGQGWADGLAGLARTHGVDVS
ncbi:restriction endonuclease [Kitasatospora kazusensis]|uniref:Restriction endonuclease n=1 Tax=Kitasatospora kazusensis TaxID=407974 RepID=A0ABN2ZEQ8_9ACTN